MRCDPSRSIWKSVRVVDGEALEMPCTAMYRGFESHLFLQPHLRVGFFYFQLVISIYAWAVLDEISDKLGEFEKRISLLENAANKSE